MKRHLAESNDFEQLSQLILNHTRERLSPTTLKRLWGYLSNEKVSTRRHTLDVLSRFVGYRSYDDFCANTANMEDAQSGSVTEEKITTDDMTPGQRLIITWRPDRRLVVRHKGNGNFEIEEALNTKLHSGDTFQCHLMIQHEPLYLDNLTHAGRGNDFLD